MLGLFRKKTKPNLNVIRELLFADTPLAGWKPHGSGVASTEPWAIFDAARSCLVGDDRAGAVAALQRVAHGAAFESRQRLQAWHCLRDLGVQPAPEEAKQVAGVVLEVHLDAGLDTLAAYADLSARHINHSGGMIVWEAPDPEIGQHITELLRAAQRIVNATGPWNKKRPGPPPKGNARINMLTPIGLHFGEGGFAALSSDAMGGPAIAAGGRLLQALVARAKSQRA
jgi:hypothetical protein